MSRNVTIACFLAAALAVPASALAAPSEYVPGEVLVKFRADAAPQHRAAAVAAKAHSAVAGLDADWSRVRVLPGESVDQAIAAYAADAAVEYAQPNFVYRIAAIPNDPSYGQLWAFKNSGQTVNSPIQPPAEVDATHNPGTYGDDIDIEPAWGVTTDCSGAVVAVLDSGVNYNHQDLAANMWNGGAAYPNHGWDFVGNGDNDPMDLNGHGTHVAGIIGAVGSNGVGVAGVCWKARIMAVRAMDAQGSGTSASIIQGINFAVARGAKVINMSLGGGGTFDSAYSAAIDNAKNAGVLVVVAAGNDGTDNDASPTYPCSFTQPNLLCVAALDQSYALAGFSNRGAASVDVGAPGVNILSTWTGTHSVTSEPISSGWYGSTTTSASGGGWYTKAASGYTFLIDPGTYPNGLYGANTDDRVWKTFSGLSGASAVTVDLQVAADLAAGDSLSAACKNAPGDAFSGGTVLDTETGVRTGRNFVPYSLDISSCASTSTTLGFQLKSLPGSPRDSGVAISPMTIKRLDLNTTSYNTIEGTSMATPVVAGVATLLRSYNPAFTFSDTVSALVQAGRSVASLSGVTTSGKAVDAMRSLAYLHPPTGLAYVIH
jgi:subtilisin family serine protease